ncbi:hypothetical protein C8J56DRAFT_925889 [Mycena floridula]|nr:hypothetical protein C8J56DRAFT_925889 [Mycena floridula]
MSKPRQSGIPTPGRASGIPTPGRPRSASNTYAEAPALPRSNSDFMNQAFADAIKANDPAHHRSNRVSDVSALSPMSASSSFAGRPSSVASSSSVSSQPPLRAKTPTSARPSSRQSDVFARSSSRAGRTYEVGDNVRIESLGFEGTLRFLGEIDGKPGLWAGVQLGGGFAGKGKNNGSVAGKSYFSCPEKCGVFVATTKLSPPTVGQGAVHGRPSSVASSRGGGRTTPSLSGRITPSTSLRNARPTPGKPAANGRVTPGGRTTPSRSDAETPAARTARLRALAKANVTPTASRTALADKITSGSRASKYVSMTARQLNTLNGSDATPGPTSTTALSSPTRPGLASPSRSTGSPFTTPKPRISSTGMGTPRGRIASAVAMPPPPSPSASSRGDDEIIGGISSQELTQRGKLLQDKIASLSGKGATPVASSRTVPSSPHRRPGSSASARSSTSTSDHIEQMQSRIDALEYENDRLRSVSNPPTADPLMSAKLETLESSYSSANMQISQLEASLQNANAAIASRDSQIQSLKLAHQTEQSELQQKLESVQSKLANSESELEALKDKLVSAETLAKSLQEVVDEKSSAEDLNGQLLAQKTKEWEASETRLKKIIVDMEEDKRETASLVDELRHAGQETIALYEERLRESDVQKYEMEDRVIDLEAKLSAAQSSSPRTSIVPSTASTTTQIDNETLQEQVLHLQKKVSTLEDLIEESRANSEREEAAIRDRMRRVKEREDSLKKEISDAKKEVERVLKTEASARGRVEEIEEAFRESTEALENAQAEVEGLRAELDNLNAVVANTTNADSTEALRKLESQNLTLKHRLEDQNAELALAHERLEEQYEELDSLRKKLNRDVTVNGNGLHSPSVTKHDLSAARDEITGLKHIVQEMQKETVAASQQNRMLESENQLLKSEMDQLRQEVKILEENLDNSILNAEQDLDQPRGSDDDALRRSLKEQKSEVEQLRKRLADAEMKNARTTHDLNKEISELEALVESKIYREDELEQEIERLKDKVSRHKKSSKSSIEAPGSSHGRDRALSNTSETSEAVCEICERPGHDIFTCDLLQDDASTSSRTTSQRASTDLFCEECEGHGHAAADCPHSLDVF